MSTTHSYDLISCNDHPNSSRLGLCTSVSPSPFTGLVVYIMGQPQADTYNLVSTGTNAMVCNNNLPSLAVANLISCADPDADKIFRLNHCLDFSERRVKLPDPYPIGRVLVLQGECDCYIVTELISTYTETATVDQDFDGCEPCQAAVTGAICEYEELTLSHAVMIRLIQPEPPSRGLDECCVKNFVLADVADNDPYRNDFSSVYYQRESDNDTITFELIGNSTGTTLLLDGTHGLKYDFDPLHTNPDLTYFRVDWRKIFGTIGVDIYKIRMNINQAGTGVVPVDSASFTLRPFSVQLADQTTRMDCKMNGTLVETGVNFKDSGYKSSIRTRGYFGNGQSKFTQDNITYSQKFGKPYFESQITSFRDVEYIWQSDTLHECLAREIIEFYYFANEIFISDYNVLNSDYRLRVFPVILEDTEDTIYHQPSRSLSLRAKFKDRQKNKRKTNC